MIRFTQNQSRLQLGCLLLLTGVCVFTAATPVQARHYEPNWVSLDQRPMPGWFNQAKFGIFVVWGPYSVPAWEKSGYAEWYGHNMFQKESPTYAFHRRVYGEDFAYEQFAQQFKAELWDPDFWCDLFVKAGAKYVVTTANYHDGFCLFPSPHAATTRTDKWDSTKVGPMRDLLGELNEAGNKRGLKMGIYYSLWEWRHPLGAAGQWDRYVREKFHPQFKDVVTRYQPPIIFLDGDWTMDEKQWRSAELAAWLYNDSPVKDYVVVNDRWGKSRGEHGDYYSSEYGGGEFPPTQPWEEDRGMGRSYGYNRNESIHDYNSRDDLIRMLSKVAGNGGNLLLDIGPTADGRIPVIMQERLLQIGDWLGVNGPAIYGSQASPFWPAKFDWGTCTAGPGKIYLHVWKTPAGPLRLPLKNNIKKAYWLANQQPVPTTRCDQGLELILPESLPDSAVSIITLEIEGPPQIIPADNETP